MQLIQTAKAPLPGGHYSQAVVANGFIYVSGLLPMIPDTNRQMPEGVFAQIEQVFKNMRAILQEAKSDIDKLVNVQIFVSDIEHWSAINDAYIQILGTHKPARTMIPCGPLHYGALIEVNAVAILADGK